MKMAHRDVKDGGGRGWKMGTCAGRGDDGAHSRDKAIS
jgi:hypothetical protein